jgi:hypothetical protein
MQALSVIITTQHATSVLELLCERGHFTGNEPGSQVKARYGDLLITWPVPTYGDIVKARADLAAWCEHARQTGLIADSIVMVINAGDEPVQPDERLTLTLVSRWAAVCEDILACLDFFDAGDASIVLVEQDESLYDYWRLTAQVESTRARELLTWCEQAQAACLLKSYELL